MPDVALAREIASVAHRSRVRRNQLLFVEGMPAQVLYVVISGQVKVYRTAADGREQIIHLLGPDELVAVVPFFDRGPYPATAEVVEDGELGCLTWAEMEHLVRERPRILLLVAQHFAARLRSAQEQIRSLGLYGAPARVAHLLLSLGEQFGTATPEGVAIELDLTRRDLGACVGLSRETTTRILTDFKKAGVISIDGKLVVIHDRDQLAAWAGQG